MKTTIVAALANLAFLSSVCASPIVPRAGKVQYAGVNLAGFDFGCGSDGTCSLGGGGSGPLDIVTQSDALGQMNHFVKDDGLNAFRLPTGWQFLVNGNLGGPLDGGNLAKYDALVQGCLNSGAELCIIDIHNYARWNGGIIGQGGPTNEQFADLWKQLATKYAAEQKIAFGIINEPHDVPDINAWADSVQAAVTAIRDAGATTQLILLPGNGWTSAETFISNGSAEALSKVTNPDGSTTGLIFDVHKYLDEDNSGTHTECVKNNIDNAFGPLATWLRDNKRQAINTETGGGNTDSCKKYMCEQIQFLNQNADVYIGYTGWAAGGFASSYELDEVPVNNGGTWTDKPLVAACIAGAWKES